MPEIVRADRHQAASSLDHESLVPELADRRSRAVQPFEKVIQLWQKQPLFQPARNVSRSPLMASFAAIVVLPTIVAAIYLVAIASPRYTSEFRVAIRSVDMPRGGGISAMMGLSGIPGVSQSANDSQAIVQYLQSHEAITDLEQTVPVRKFYQNERIDFYSRLAPKEPIERVVKYWHGMLNAYYESSTGTVVVAISAFTPQEALAIAENLRQLSERLVNRMSERMRSDTVSIAQREVDRSEKRLHDATELTRIAQDKFKIIDPKQAADSTLSLAAKLQDEIVRLKAEIDVQSTYLNAQSPTMKIRFEQLQSLQTQLNALRSQVTASGDDVNSQSLSSVISKFSHLQSEQMFADKSYQGALASLDAARTEAMRQQAYLQTIVRPSLPEQQTFPRPVFNISTVGGISLTIWAILLFVVHGIREHL